MCLLTTLHLLENCSKTVQHDAVISTAPCFQFGKDEVLKGDDTILFADVNETGVNLKERLEEMTENWDLSMAVILQPSQHNANGIIQIPRVSVELRAEILNLIHSSVIWNLKQEYYLQVSMNLAGECAADKDTNGDGAEHGINGDENVIRLSIQCLNLFPRTSHTDGSKSHSCYTGELIKSGVEPLLETAFFSINRWKVSELNVFIQHSRCNCRKIVADKQAEWLIQQMMETGITDNMHIVARGGEKIPCFDFFLIGKSKKVIKVMLQSKVIKTSLEQNKFLEGSTREINMLDYSPGVIRAFLKFMYYGDVMQARLDAMVNFNLFVLGYMFEVSKLEREMRHILMKRPRQLIPISAAIKMFAFAERRNDDEIMKKAMHTLKLCSDHKIQEDAWFCEIFPSPTARQMFLLALRLQIV